MYKSMDHTHPDAFVDWPMKEPSYMGNVMCPKCKGHGGWNLNLNCYPLHGKEDTPENRHRYSHFRAMCGLCWGYGWGTEERFKCDHDWVFEQNLGRCYNRYRCASCSATWDCDSSD